MSRTPSKPATPELERPPAVRRVTQRNRRPSAVQTDAGHRASTRGVQTRARPHPVTTDEPDRLEADEKASVANVPPVLPHHLACTPRRPPRWVRPAPRRDAGIRPRALREGWHAPRIRTAPGGGQIRTNFTYANSFMTSADFSPTTGRDVYGEGPFEGIYRSILSTDHDTAEFTFQIGTITWTTDDGEARSYTMDGGRVTVAGREIWFEVKAHATYFADPEVNATIDAAEAALASHDIFVERIDGSTLLDPVRLLSVNDVLRHRNVGFTDHDVQRTLELIERHGGVAPFAAVVEILHSRPRQARAMACSMLIRRIIGFDVRLPVTGDTLVWAFRHPARRLSKLDE